MELIELELNDLNKFFLINSSIYNSDEKFPEIPENVINQFKNAPIKVIAYIVEDNKQIQCRCAILFDKEVRFSHFEAIPTSQNAVKFMFKEIVRIHGLDRLIGPKWSNLEKGLLTSGFNQPQTVLTAYNPKYYAKFLKKAGFKQKEKMITFYFDRTMKLNEIQNRIESNINPRVKTRTFDRNKLENEIMVFNKINRAVFSQTPDYYIRSIEEDRLLVESLLPIINDNYIIIAEVDEIPIGMLLALPDVYEQTQPISRVRIISIGVMPEWHRKKVGLTMGAHLFKILKPNMDLKYLEASIILKHNLPPQLLARKFKAKAGRQFSMFQLG
ncbi:MAG: hypothetical protein GPJ54_21015 [Candidatus Heimdallarchaeota archaeon]|nr:hypothetical protein [Candidatus Heimdallarchaeota archaeon]